MYEYCVICKKKKEHFGWKNQGDGWICGDHFKTTPHEWVPQRIKDDRKTYKKDTLQPWRSGEPSAEFIEAYPERSKKLFTEKQRRNAKKVWN